MSHISYLSPSQIDMFSRCPEQWRRRYLESEIMPPGVALCLGGAVHAGAEIDLVEKIETGEDVPEEQVVDEAVAEYDRRVMEQGVYLSTEESEIGIGKVLGEGKDQAVALSRLWRREVAPVTMPAMVEHRGSVSPPELGGVDLLGILDLLTTDHVLDDLKTAKQRWQQDKAETETAPVIYREIVRQETGRYPVDQSYTVLVKPKQAVKLSDLLDAPADDAKAQEKLKNHVQRLTTNRDDSDFQVLLRRSQVMLAMIEAGTFPPTVNRPFPCSPDWCGYFGTCAFQSQRVMVALAQVKADKLVEKARKEEEKKAKAEAKAAKKKEKSK